VAYRAPSLFPTLVTLMTKRVTQQDIARLANVSRPTVSRVLNNRVQGPVLVPEETCRRIFAAAEQLGYQPHAAARSLRSGRTNTVGLVLPDAFNPHHLAILRGVEAETRRHDYQLIFSVSNIVCEQERESLLSLAQKSMDGLILVLSFADRLESELQLLRQQGSPLVTLTAEPPGADTILQSYASGTQQIMEHLLGLGHRRIGFIHGAAEPTLGAERVAAYRAALAAAGLPQNDQLVIHCGPTIEDGLVAARQLLALPARPSAIVGLNDLMAIGALQAASECGLAVPGDLSIVGFDDIDVARYLVPPLTTWRANSEEIGRQGARLLLQRLENPDLPPQSVTIDAALVIRGSTGPCQECERSAAS
jgi:LacI family transcriptional regulator